MGHFTVMVIGDNPEEQLAKFDKNLEVPPYILYTRQQLIDKEKREIENYKNTIYAEYLENPEEYKKKSPSQAHILFLEEELPKRFQWTDEEILEYALKWFNKEDIDEDGNVLSRHNPNSKFDFYTLANNLSEGLKEGYNLFKEASKTASVYKKDIVDFDNMIVSAVVKDGIWYEKPYVGTWWEMLISDEVGEDNYKEVGKNICASVSEDTLISIFDCQI